jgi:integrase
MGDAMHEAIKNARTAKPKIELVTPTPKAKKSSPKETPPKRRVVGIHNLTDTKIEAALKVARAAVAKGEGKPVLLGDGGGLTLQISRTGTASWLHRYMRQGKPVGLGLGPYPAVSLKSARNKAEELRQQLAHGKDPLAEKRAQQSEEKLAATSQATFDSCAATYISDHKAEWKSVKHAQQWTNTLAMYASPIIGDREIGSIATADLVRILKPIWLTKNETASRVRGRIESVLDWATAHGMRSGENPARFRGHLEHLLARSTPEQREEKHHLAMPHDKIPDFFVDLAKQDGMSRWALEFLILTACRTSEVLGAQWQEVSSDGTLWVISKDRMKAGKEHRVPLVPRALQILEQVKPYKKGAGVYIFPSGSKDKPLSNMALSMLLRRMGITKATVHGFRSTFRDWVGEKTTHDHRTAEAALAHKLPDKVAAAYARSDLYEKRFIMMNDWATHCASGEA